MLRQKVADLSKVTNLKVLMAEKVLMSDELQCSRINFEEWLQYTVIFQKIKHQKKKLLPILHPKPPESS